MSNNPLDNIFLKSPSGKITEELDNINNIELFFLFINNDKIEDKQKEIVIKDLTSKIKVNRYISEFFSIYKNKSIYIYLFDLYTKNNTTKELKEAIIFLIEELLSNIQTGKDIYEYIFQKLAQIYRGEIPAIEKYIYDYLKLLNTLFSDIDSKQPKNYIACSGNCQFFVDFSKLPIELGYCFSLNINFRISNYEGNMQNPEKNRKSTLVKIFFDNQKSITIDLQYPFQLIAKEIRKEFIKTLPIDVWVNLVISIINNNNKYLQVNFYVNGENSVTSYKIEKLGLKNNSKIQYIYLFSNFYGEVSSIFMYSQKDKETPLANNSNYLSQLKNNKEGLWKKKKIDAFLKSLQNYKSKKNETQKANTNLSSSVKIAERKKNLLDYLEFLFTPINYSKKNPNVIEDAFLKYELKFNGNIRVHKYLSYQKKLSLLGGFSNFYPIAEMFLIYPQILTEKNLEIFLKIIGNILNFRKQNLTIVNKSRLFKILSMFMEKYPNKVYTENILNEFFSLARILFINNLETECSNYFNYILLNEKILSKYNENLQSTFWDKLLKFCQSDITQFLTSLNMNRLCLILRFYDRNKYKEMCCQEHLDIIKNQYRGSLKVMNPTMNTKLAQLKDIMDLIIDSSESNNALSFFKLLTLDLSPCLIKFIIAIFIKAFNKQKVNEEWKIKFINQLINAKYEVIIFNTFIHALPDVRYELLTFISQIHNKLVIYNKNSSIKTLEEMLKTCLLPEKMFFHKKILSQEKDNIKTELDKKNDEEIENKTLKEIQGESIKKTELKNEITHSNIQLKESEENTKIEMRKNSEDKNKVKEEEIINKKEEKNIEIKEIKNKEESKKETPKKEPLKKSETKNIGSNKKTDNKKDPSKVAILKSHTNDLILEKNQSVELRHQKTLQINEDAYHPDNTKRKNFLALLSKFEKPKEETNKDPIKAPLKLINKDNPFLKKQEEEKKKRNKKRKKKKN